MAPTKLFFMSAVTAAAAVGTAWGWRATQCPLPQLYLTTVVKSEPLCNIEMGSKGVVPSRFLAGMAISQYNTEFLKTYKTKVIFRRSSHAQGLPFSSMFWLQFLSQTLIGKMVDSLLIAFTSS